MRSIISTVTLLACCLSTFAEETAAGSAAIYDQLWGYAALYTHAESRGLQRLALTGRLQGDAATFDSDSDYHEELVWRRLRLGGKANLSHHLLVHAEADLDLNEAGSNDAYKGLTDAYIGWQPVSRLNLKLGKQSAPFTLDGATSSTRLITMERSIVAENLWFTTEYFTGAALIGTQAAWRYRLGIYSSSGDAEFGSFDSGYFALASLGKTISSKRRDGTLAIRGDYVYNDPDYSGDVGTRDLRQVVSLVTSMQAGAIGLGSDLSFGEGIDGQSDLWGLQLMPSYAFSERWQTLFRYAVVSSLDGAGVRMGRYARKIEPSLADVVHDFYLGLNCYLYGHKLKWQSGLEYNVATDLASTGDTYRGWGLSTGLRLYW